MLLTLKEKNKNKKHTWYTDNEESNHMIDDRSKFMKFDGNIVRHVTFEDSSKVKIKVKGTILIQSRNDNHKMLFDVYYILKLMCINCFCFLLLLTTLIRGEQKLVWFKND